MARIRVAAYNVQMLRAGTRRVAAALADVRPDVLILNETGYVGLKLRRFARRLGMRRSSGLHGIRRIPNAVFVRAPWRIVGSRTLRFPRLHRTVRRGAVVSEVARAGARLWVVAVHLGLAADERRRHAEVLTDDLAGVRPVVIGGDLNEDPSGAAATWIRSRYWDAFGDVLAGEAPTFPSHSARARIDYVFVSDAINVERAWVHVAAGDASDPLPVFADLEGAD
ncbi:MAG TPA: endonuclease/exonuclease/phosphatase family protein [Actinomycetota bacterium]|nr:endonuclease/exonuclease/phosphatase family protein [Actinomycetota bacterium]